MSNTKTLVVVSGGLSEESTTHRLAEGLADQVVAQAKSLGLDVRVRRHNVRDYAHELASASLSGFASGALASAYDDLAQADAVIAVTPTYKASYTGLFKAFWDVTADGVMAGVPVIVGATGGTPRHSLVTDTALRPLFAYMKSLTMPTAVYAAAEDWAGSQLSRRMAEAAGELVRHLNDGASGVQFGEIGSTNGDDSSPDSVRTLANTRSKASDPFSNVPTMDELLRR